jgi:hypothetical protein
MAVTTAVVCHTPVATFRTTVNMSTKLYCPALNKGCEYPFLPGDQVMVRLKWLPEQGGYVSHLP